MKEMFLGLGEFVWWFGIVENRIDPLELGRCQVRCFGWHNDDKNQIPTQDIPWAHPVIPYGVKAVQPPAEGTMVFGFFADGKQGQYPIIIGTVPGVPEELRDNNLGFTDPYTEAQKESLSFPRKIREAAIKTDTTGVRVVEDTAKRNPSNLNEPTISRLAHPTRGVTESGEYDGIQPESIANTAIDIQRKTRITDIKTAAGSTWDEPYPSYNAQYPFNNVTETESGHAFEMDDTRNFERVQLSHRTGSTLEFLPEGHTKIKSQSGRYDVTMGDHRNYVNGTKYETVDSDYFLRVNGKLRIECDVFEVVCKGNPGTATITAENGAIIKGGSQVAITGLSSAVTGGTVSINGAVSTSIFGGKNSSMSSGGQASIGGTLVHFGGNIVEVDAQVFKTHGIQDFNSCLPPLGEVLKVEEPNISVNTEVEIGSAPRIVIPFSEGG